MLWELFQTSRIEQSNWRAEDAKSSAREAQVDVRELRRKIEVLEKQCERLTLAAMAMAEIMRDKLNCSEQEIEAKLVEIDLRDGRLDGQYRAAPGQCPGCNRPNGGSRRQCLYCGASLTSGSFLFQSGDGATAET